MRLDLSKYQNNSFNRGASRIKEGFWLVLHCLFCSGIPGSKWRIALLRAFGASVGDNVVIKQYVKVKFPWRLSIGANSWIGESCWIDNLGFVSIGSNSCLSQGAYLCTGSHRWDLPSFDLVVADISIGEGCWICAFSKIAPGSIVSDGSVIGFGVTFKGKTMLNEIVR